MHFHEIWCSFSGVVDESMCAIRTFFFLFFDTIHLAHLKWNNQLFEASETTPHFSRAVSFPKTAPENAPIMHHSINTSNNVKEKQKQTVNQRHPRNINWKTEGLRWRHLTSSSSMQHTVASYRNQQALFFQRKSNGEAIHCPSTQKHNHKPKKRRSVWPWKRWRWWWNRCRSEKREKEKKKQTNK